MKPTLGECIDAVSKLCEGYDFDYNEIRHRARLLYLINRLEFFEEMPVFFEEVEYQKKKVLEAKP